MTGRVLLALAALTACAEGKAPVAREESIRQCEILEGSPENRAFVRCLVDRFHWNVDSASVAAEYLAAGQRAELRRMEDSLAKVEDSLAGELRRADSSIRARQAAAVREEQVRARREAKRAGITLLAGDRRRKVYFWNTSLCGDHGLTASPDLVYFWDREEAEAAGFQSSRKPYCQVVSWYQ